MTRDDFAAFKAAIERTGTAFSKALPSDLVSTYYRDLDAYPLPAVLAALDKARQSGKFFPRVATLRELCQSDSAVTVGTDVPGWVNHDEGIYFCSGCADTGFVRGLTCQGDGTCHIGGCGREGHATDVHGYTRRCDCRPTNPVLRRQRELLAQRIAKVEA